MRKYIFYRSSFLALFGHLSILLLDLHFRLNFPWIFKSPLNVKICRYFTDERVLGFFSGFPIFCCCYRLTATIQIRKKALERWRGVEIAWPRLWRVLQRGFWPPRARRFECAKFLAAFNSYNESGPQVDCHQIFLL